MAKRTPKEPVILTREQTIEKAYKDHIDWNRQDTPIDSMPLPPANRVLKVGDAIIYGALRDCVVTELRDNNRTIIFEYASYDTAYGKNIYLHQDYRACHWTEALAKNEIDDGTKLAKKAYNIGSYLHGDISSILHQVYANGLRDSPDYQRGYVWTLDDKVRFIDSIFQNRELGKLILIRDSSYKVNGFEVLDGKQRLSALMEYYESRFPYNGKHFHEISNVDRYYFEGRAIQYMIIESANVNRKILLEIFLNVNAAGVPQTEEHLDHVRKLLADELAK